MLQRPPPSQESNNTLMLSASTIEYVLRSPDGLAHSHSIPSASRVAHPPPQDILISKTVTAMIAVKRTRLSLAGAAHRTRPVTLVPKQKETISSGHHRIHTHTFAAVRGVEYGDPGGEWCPRSGVQHGGELARLGKRIPSAPMMMDRWRPGASSAMSVGCICG